MTHLVNRLCFEIGCADEEQAFDVRHNMSRVVQEIALDTIDRVCSEHVGEDEWLRIDTIEVDLGHLSRAAIERDFAAVFRDRFEKALVKKLHARRLEPGVSSMAHSRFELFCNLMRTGLLPWWAASENADPGALAVELCTHMPEQVRAFLYANRSDAVLWRRLALQLGDSGSQAVIALVPLLRAAETAVTESFPRPSSHPPYGDEQSAPLSPSPAWLVEARRLILEQAPALLGSSQPNDVPARIAAAVAREIGVAAQDASDRPSILTPPRTRRETPSAALVTDASREGARAAGAAAAVPPTDTTRNAEPAAEAAFVVRHSGIVLLAPFFVRFFDACGLIEDLRWTSKDMQYAAVHLLGYLCNGTEGQPEHDLPLEKLCCGITLDDPIPRDAKLSERQRAEARSLLASVIEHWSALRNTSIDGLRETFLERDGIVSRKEDGDWLLRVERRTLDVLVDRLPWGFSTLAMPWNDYVIHVEW